MSTSIISRFGKINALLLLFFIILASGCTDKNDPDDPKDGDPTYGACQFPLMKSLNDNQLPSIGIGDIKALGQTNSYAIFGYSFIPKLDGQISKIGLRLPEKNIGTAHTVRLYDTDLLNQIPLQEAIVTPLSSSSFNYVDIDPTAVMKDIEYMVCVYMPVIAAVDDPLTEFHHITDVAYPFTVDDIIINGYAYNQDQEKVKPEPKGTNSIIMNGFVDICFQAEE